MKFIKKIERNYGILPVEIWETKDHFTITLLREKDISISVNNKQGYCTKCIYKKMQTINPNLNIQYGGVMPPTIKFNEQDFETVMDTIDNVEKNNLYFEVIS